MFFLKKKEDFNFPEKIIIKGKTFEILVELISKSSSSVIIKNKSIVFKLSSKTSKKQIQLHFDKLLSRIVKKLEKSNFEDFKGIEDVLIDRKFKFAGEEFFIEFWGRKSGKIIKNKVFLNASFSNEENQNIIEKLLCKRFYEKVQEYIFNLNENTYNYTITGFDLKCLNSKWGHCTGSNKIMLNIKLLNAPKEVLDYVIYHEISHIKHKNHSKSFWNEVFRYCPNYKKNEKVLKDNPPRIFY